MSKQSLLFALLDEFAFTPDSEEDKNLLLRLAAKEIQRYEQRLAALNLFVSGLKTVKPVPHSDDQPAPNSWPYFLGLLSDYAWTSKRGDDSSEVLRRLAEFELSTSDIPDEAYEVLDVELAVRFLKNRKNARAKRGRMAQKLFDLLASKTRAPETTPDPYTVDYDLSEDPDVCSTLASMFEDLEKRAAPEIVCRYWDTLKTFPLSLPAETEAFISNKKNAQKKRARRLMSLIAEGCFGFKHQILLWDTFMKLSDLALNTGPARYRTASRQQLCSFLQLLPKLAVPDEIEGDAHAGLRPIFKYAQNAGQVSRFSGPRMNAVANFNGIKHSVEGCLNSRRFVIIPVTTS